MDRNGAVRFLPLAAILAVTAHAPMTSAMECSDEQDVATVCTSYEGGDEQCSTTIYYYEVCESSGGDGGGGDSGGSDGGGSDGGGNYFDADSDGYIDEWRGVVATSDPCANNFDTNDRLGTDHGGTNTVRPHHAGVDMQANEGDAIYPFRSGTVAEVGWTEGCGYRVKIDHGDGTWATYCHMVGDSSPLSAGTYVSAGWDFIGKVDSTGNSSGHHLHLTYDVHGQKKEYFGYTGSQPTAGQLVEGGC